MYGATPNTSPMHESSARRESVNPPQAASFPAVEQSRRAVGWWIGIGVGEVLLISALSMIAYYQIFSFFALYDDEGYMMLTVKHFLAGHPLYDAVWTLYGPVYFFYKWIVHGLFRLPLSHDAVRFTSIVIWISIAVMAGIAALSLTRNAALAAVVQLLTTLHLFRIANEPGHPQELAALFTMAVIAVAARARGRTPRRTLIALGFLVAAVTMTKVNLGIFVGLGVGMASLSLIPLSAASAVLRVISGGALTALPLLLMRPLLDNPSVWNFAATEAISIGALSLVALTQRGGGLRISGLFTFALSGLGGVALIALATVATGTTISALIDCLVAAPARMPSLFVLMFAGLFSGPTWTVWAIAVGLIACLSRWPRTQPHVLACAKLAFGIAALKASWDRDLTLLIGGLTPFLWLALPFDATGDEAPAPLGRFALCWIAVLQPLQAYPVSGSQIHFGTVVHVLVGAVCLGDGLRWLRSRAALLDRRVVRGALAGAVMVAVGYVSVDQVQQAHQQYAALEPLGLKGTKRMHVPPQDAQVLRKLVDTLWEQADTFLCIPGFNSLYFWTETEPPTLDVIGHQMRFYSDERQAAMLNALLEHEHPMVVHFQGLGEPYPPLEEQLAARFTPSTQIGGYQLLVPR
jgi:hypothetical protein